MELVKQLVASTATTVLAATPFWIALCLDVSRVEVLPATSLLQTSST